MAESRLQRMLSFPPAAKNIGDSRTSIHHEDEK